jgi:class 3 adenylate cyclase
MSTESIECPACAQRNPEAARFCNQCGARLQAAAQTGYTPQHLQQTVHRQAAVQGERKRVTVLFADIKGSTRLAEQAGAELWHHILDRFFAILGAAVHRYQGTVNQYTGDGIMALFGAPQALEDHAAHAAFAALDMQRDVRRYADELRLQHGINLTLRVGLNSGDVVVGRIGDDLRSDYTAQGPTVHLAARMEQICEPGRIYVSSQTAALLEGAFRLRSLGATQIAGFDTTVVVSELEGVASGLRTRLDRSLARSGAPLIGRESELQQLTAAFERVRHGAGQVVAVVGSAGIGKSRLCREFVIACEREGVTVHRTTGVPYASRLPLLPIRHLLRSKLGVPDDATPEETRRWVAGALLLEDPANAAVLPHVFEFLGVRDQFEQQPDAVAGARERMLEQLADYLPCSAEPTILLIEDLHFLDAGSEAFLTHLCRSVARKKCLLLLNFRPDYALEWLQPLVHESIPLTALSSAHLLQLAQTLLGEDPSVAGVAEIVAQRAGGNPYFVEEAVLALADGGWLQGQPRAWRLVRAVAEWPVPDSVQALLAARIDRLPDAARSLLQVAAVIGQQFDQDLLQTLAGMDRDHIAAQLAVLEELGLVHTLDDGFAFCHPLVQEVAYLGQLESRRRAVHAQLAELLEQRHGTQDAPTELAVRIAEHWQRAGVWARAGHWNLLGFRWAMLHDAELALDQCRRAVAHFDRADSSAEVEHGRVLARAALIRMAQFARIPGDEVERAWREARTLAQDDVAAQVELQISYGNELLHRGEVDAAARVHQDAAQRCLDTGHTELLNRFRLAVLLSGNAAGRVRSGLEILDRAGGDWRRRPIDEENHASRGFYGLMLTWQGRLDAARAEIDGAVSFAESQQHPVSWMYANRVDLALLSGDLSGIEQSAYRSLEYAEQHGSPFFRAVALRAVALMHLLHGRAQPAIDALIEAWPMVVAGAPAHQFESNHLSTHALALLVAQRDAEAAAMALQACDSARRSGSRVWEIIGLVAWLRLHPTPQRRARADEMLQRVRWLIDDTGAEGFRPWLELAYGHWTTDPAERAAAHLRAQQAFDAIGARVYARRIADKRNTEPAGMGQLL